MSVAAAYAEWSNAEVLELDPPRAGSNQDDEDAELALAPQATTMAATSSVRKRINYAVDLDKLLKGPIDEVMATHQASEAQFLVEHMKNSLRGLEPTIESFEYFNLKLEDENRKLAEEESDLDDRLAALGIVVQNEDDLEVGYDSEEDLQNLIEFDRMEVDEILEMVRRDVSVVKQLEAQAPQAVKEFLESVEFWETVKARYEDLDTDNSGAIEAEELFPVIVELTSSEAWAVTMDHCQKFLRFFDSDGNGILSIDEFFDLLRFCVVITNLDNSPAAGAIEAEGEFNVAEAKSHVDEIIKCVAYDAKLIDTFQQQCPDSVKAFLASAEFWTEVQQRYMELDVAKNGVVEPEELFPIIIELTNSEPWAVTDIHCRKFAQIFDSNGDGKINMQEFENLVRFTVVMSAMDEQVELQLGEDNENS